MGTKCNDRKDVEDIDNDTLETEADSIESVLDSVLSTCCCYGDSEGRNSLVDKNREEQQQQEDDDSPKFLERISDVFLFLIGGAPPVKFVSDCGSASNFLRRNSTRYLFSKRYLSHFLYGKASQSK